jgi:hypothetical protein
LGWSFQPLAFSSQESSTAYGMKACWGHQLEVPQAGQLSYSDLRNCYLYPLLVISSGGKRSNDVKHKNRM